MCDECYGLVWRAWKKIYETDKSPEILQSLKDAAKQRVTRGEFLARLTKSDDIYIEHTEGFPYQLYDLMCCSLFVFQNRKKAIGFAVELAVHLKQHFLGTDEFIERVDLDWNFIRSSSVQAIAQQLIMNAFNVDLI